MLELSPEYSALAREFNMLITKMYIHQRAVELALKRLDLSDDDWQRCLLEANSSLGITVLPESSLEKLAAHLASLQAHL